ncbi:hypothetical protein [Mycolicibacterium fallax]|uniref:Uncharacterized protein n=1 Tax=Mycolicibacterium fallax TaxID=1793 RepID=A0A1X1RA34_MYCFA|nr:hypothetical protein [Mycolicibacterium fallax]ORV02045.1 hypothetical protein AWC04_12495 [Mycolicibacterium fallax]BBY99803.1 hypothetical protein MFAL_32700 [Mycolicibacterium fallax]HSA40218.1 hypothetical protein [Mycobacterium sp.]
MDAGYLSTLSPDADAALLRLPEQARRCVARPQQPARSWTEFNLSRSQALPAAGAAVSGCSSYTGVSRTG